MTFSRTDRFPCAGKRYKRRLPDLDELAHMLLISRRLATGMLLVPFAGVRLAGAAPAAATRITFVLVNDIYLMADDLMPDGKRRGGFPRLAAVVKAEREMASATGSQVIFAHGGDTLSPSLMSGIDKGAHIITLTNLIPPDIFAPGNHEFDFGKAVFLERMGEAKFPLYGANLRGPDGAPLPGFKDRSIVTVGNVRIGLTGAAFDDSVRASDPGDLKFLPTVATIKQQAEALRREGADFVVAVAHATREEAYEVFNSRTVDLILTGHTHDLFINYDGRTALVESNYDAHYVTAIDIAIDVKEEDGHRTTTWWPQFRVTDTATVTPDPEVAAVVAKFEGELSKQLDVPIGTTAVELDSRTAVVRTREAAIGNLVADALRWSAQTEVAVTNGGGIRGGKIYPPGTTITRRDILTELPFGNRLVTLEVSGRDLKAAIENGLSRLPNPSGRFPQVSGLKIEADVSRPAGSRVQSITVGDAPLYEGKVYSVATNDFMARGGDDYTAFEQSKPVIPLNDSPLMASEVMDYIQDIRTVRTGVDGRIVLKG
jgi:2',3'-cyclic-nucleotide 2'-phosphodiesterase (5'-nucleotidase family)